MTSFPIRVMKYAMFFGSLLTSDTEADAVNTERVIRNLRSKDTWYFSYFVLKLYLE